MVGQSRKWMVLVATTWVQAFTGTNFDFSSYSSDLKSALGMTQLQLNYLSVASDLGKAFGWCSGVSLLYLPLPLVLFISAFIGLFAYGVQFFLIRGFFSLPYFAVFLLCLLAGCSICWFNTVCYVLCIKNFSTNRPLALSLTISFNGVSAALYTLVVNAINPDDDSLYLLVNALGPLITSVLALAPILREPPPHTLPTDAVRRDSVVFLILNLLAAFTGLYLLLLYSLSSNAVTARFLLAGAIVLLIMPLFIPGIVYARAWAQRTIHSSFRLNGSGFNLVDIDDLELHKALLENEGNTGRNGSTCGGDGDVDYDANGKGASCYGCGVVVEKDQLTVLGEEHSAKKLLSRWDFWLYYLTYFCGGTVGLVYSNNIGQISQSLGYSTSTSSIVAIYSSCSFFGRLLSAAPDFLRDKVYFARTGWLAIALLPTSIAFLLLLMSGSKMTLQAGTALIGLSSGFIFAAAVSITSELFGPNSAGVNHNILITNIPIGSVLYGLLAAEVYDSNIPGNGDTMVCMGRECYKETFVWWACISLFGLICSVLLFLRTRPAYCCFERTRGMNQSP